MDEINCAFNGSIGHLDETEWRQVSALLQAFKSCDAVGLRRLVRGYEGKPEALDRVLQGVARHNLLHDVPGYLNWRYAPDKHRAIFRAYFQDSPLPNVVVNVAPGKDSR